MRGQLVGPRYKEKRTTLLNKSQVEKHISIAIMVLYIENFICRIIQDF